jgi:hypothetical protein
MVTALKPRRYECQQPSCHFRGQVRLVHPVRYWVGMLDWPGPFCECSPDVEMVRLPDPEQTKSGRSPRLKP